MSEAAQQLQAANAAGLRCHKCGSPRLHRSHMRGLRERMIKLISDARAWRCEGCGGRQLSVLRPPKRRSSSSGKDERNVNVELRPNPSPDPIPAPAPEPHPAPSPIPDPNPRRTRRRDPLAEKLKLRRQKKLLVTAVLVVLAGLGGALIVMRTSGPAVAALEE